MSTLSEPLRGGTKLLPTWRAKSHGVRLAAVESPTVDSLKALENSRPLLLAHGCHLGLRRQAALFTKLDEALQKHPLASTARLSEPPGSRRVDQQLREERLHFSRQREKRQGHGAATRRVELGTWVAWYQVFTQYQVCYQALPVST